MFHPFGVGMMWVDGFWGAGREEGVEREKKKEVAADAKIRIVLFRELPTLSQYFHVEKIYNVY